MWFRIKVYLAAAATFVAAVALAFLRGRATRESEIKAAENEERLDASRRAREIENEVEALDPDTLRERSRVWLRKRKD